MSKEIYSGMIKSALPGALVRYVDNYDDYHYGWDISPKPGTLIQMKVAMNDAMYIAIELFEVFTYNVTVRYKRIFSGQIPADKTITGPDWDFIEGILRNYDKF